MELPAMSDDVKKLNPELFPTLVEKPSKYRNKRTFALDRTFASGREAVRAGELMLAQKATAIFGLQFQVSFPLPGGIEYRSDFFYAELQNGRLEIVVEDSKGFITPEYKLKKKLFKETYGIEIKEV